MVKSVDWATDETKNSHVLFCSTLCTHVLGCGVSVVARAHTRGALYLQTGGTSLCLAGLLTEKQPQRHQSCSCGRVL